MFQAKNIQDTRPFFFDTWEKHKRSKPLTPLEAQLIDVILSHPEYHALLDNPKLATDRTYFAELGETNPFLHMGLHLASCGADIIKAGIGGGSVCSTRVKTGFGIPMLTCIEDCARTDRSIVADGGLRASGDIVKALAFGADFVMIGGMLAGTDPTPGEVITKEDGSKIKRYRGMASREAQEGFLGQLQEWKTAEGVSAEVPYHDNQDGIIGDIIGGLRSGLTYAGADSISELQRKLNYIQVTPAGRHESLPHKLID